MSVFRVEKNSNYTVLSNYHLRDKNLSLRTIGLLSIILSLPDNWDYSQAGLAAICKDGEDSVRRGLKELEDNGYLKRERERDHKGRVKGIIYHVFENPNLINEYKKPNCDFPMQVKHTKDNQVVDKPSEGKKCQINKDTTTKEKLNTNSSIHQSPDTCSYRSKVERIVKENIGYDFLIFKHTSLNEKLEQDAISLEEYLLQSNTYNPALINRVVAYMLDVITSLNTDPILIGNDLIDREVVKEKLLCVDMIAFKRTIQQLSTQNISNPKKYAISMLYNS